MVILTTGKFIGRNRLSSLFAWRQQPIEIVVINRSTRQILEQSRITISPEMYHISDYGHRFQAIWFLIPATVAVRSLTSK